MNLFLTLIEVSTLQMFWNYDGDWATRKVKLGYTPHFASYDIEQKVVTVACSREEKIEMLPKITAEGNKEYEAMPDIPNIGKLHPSQGSTYRQSVFIRS